MGSECQGVRGQSEAEETQTPGDAVGPGGQGGAVQHRGANRGGAEELKGTSGDRARRLVCLGGGGGRGRLGGPSETQESAGPAER